MLDNNFYCYAITSNFLNYLVFFSHDKSQLRSAKHFVKEDMEIGNESIWKKLILSVIGKMNINITPTFMESYHLKTKLIMLVRMLEREELMTVWMKTDSAVMANFTIPTKWNTQLLYTLAISLPDSNGYLCIHVYRHAISRSQSKRTKIIITGGIN